MNWTISKKILAGYTISIAFVLALSAGVFIDLHSLSDEYRTRTLIVERLDVLSQIDILLRDAETGQRGFVITGAEVFLDPYQNARKQYPATIAKLEKLAEGNPAELTQITNLHERAEAKIASMEQTIDTRREKGFEAAAAVVSQQTGKKIMDEIRVILGNIRDMENDASAVALKQVNTRIENLILLMAIGAPIAIITMLIAGLLTARSLSRPISLLTLAAKRIADGNLSSSITPLDRSDEVGALSRSFARMNDSLQRAATANSRIASGDLSITVTPQSDEDDLGKTQASMIHELSLLIGQVQQSGVQVNSSAVEIAAVAKQQQATASEVATTTTEISATAREMSATSIELLRSADQVSLVAGETASLATQGKANLNRMEAIIQQISDASSTVTGRLGVMNEKAGNINAVITTITKVADQTNLLSLNAAIEAEKAGEYGKGFSVVATEIRRLADQTAASSGDIERIVKELTSAVSAGVMGMDKFSEEVRRGANEIGDTRRQLDEVVAQVQSLAPSVETLHEGMRAQTQGAEQISDALSQLGEAARQTADSIRDSSRAVEQLNDASRGLQGAISRFKIRP